MQSIYRFLGRSPKTQLGPLEQQLLEELWKCNSATVRELLDRHLIDGGRGWHIQLDSQSASPGDAARNITFYDATAVVVPSPMPISTSLL